MPEEKGLGSKLLGLFVEQKEQGEGTSAPAEDGASPADLIADLARQSDPRQAAAALPPRPAGPAPVRQPSPIASSGPVTPASVDFDAVFKGAGLDSGELDRVRKAEELLKSLPESTPQDIKRQIVEASLKAFGFDVQKIIVAAQNQVKAVETWTLADLGVSADEVGLDAAWTKVTSFEARPPRAKGTIVKDEGDGGAKLAGFLAERKFI